MCKINKQGELNMKIELPALPYAQNALEPIISEKTFQFHYGKHHNAYVENTKKLIAGTEFEELSLEEIIKKTYKDKSKIGLFNNSAQVWNHSFYWNCIKPSGGGIPTGKIADLINQSFGSFEKFTDEFKNAAMTQFGSGWAWLVLNENNDLEIRKTANAETPLTYNCKALLTIDVWEHAYYLDYQNKRPEYIDNFINKLINWDFVNSNL
jgi:superoxide dismutase, Fe-Mn family